MWNRFLYLFFGDEKTFGASMRHHRLKTSLKVFLVVLISCSSFLGVRWAIWFLGPPVHTPSYSSTQDIRLYGPMEENFINLDNAGTLRPYVYIFKGFNPANNISFILNATPSILGKEYMPNGGGLNDGRATYYTQIFKENDLIIFNTTLQKSREIKTHGRTFMVTLFTIKNLDDGNGNFEYQFGIEEK